MKERGVASLQLRCVRKCRNIFKRNKARWCSSQIMGNKWVYCAMGSQNILNNSPFANHPSYRVFTHAIANLFFSSSICSARRNGNLVEIMEDLSPTEGSRILKILLDAIVYDLNEYSWRGRSGPWLGRK